MRAIVLVVMAVLVHQPFQMPFIQHDHMVEQIVTATADPALGDAVLPRTAEADPLGLDAKVRERGRQLASAPPADDSWAQRFRCEV